MVSPVLPRRAPCPDASGRTFRRPSSSRQDPCPVRGERSRRRSSPSRGSSAPASVAPPRCLPASPSPHRKAPSLDFLPVHASGLSHPFRQHPLSSYAPCPPAKRSEEHTSELQSLRHLVCRLLLE